VIHHRLAHELYLLGVPLLARIVAEIAHSETGIDIHPGAIIGASFFIDHGTGVVIYAGATVLGRITIGRGSSIGGNVWLTHSVPPGSNVTQATSRHELPQSEAVRT